MQATPDADVWRWVAGLFGSALLLVLGAIMTLVFKERKAAQVRPRFVPNGPRWAEERGAILYRLEKSEEDLSDLEGRVERLERE